MSASTVSQQKQERIDLRTTKEVKDLLIRAATLSRVSISSFLLEAACERAKHVIAKEESLILSDYERDRFLELLESPQKPNPRLKKAMQHYHEITS